MSERAPTTGPRAVRERASRSRRVPAGPRGLAVLAASGIAGLVLAFHGWSGYHGQATPGLAGHGVSAGQADSPASSPIPRHTTSAGATRDRRGQASPPGPLLASQAYAQYAFQVWPGPPSTTAKAALTGLVVTVRREPTGLSVTAGVTGQPSGSPRLYRQGARVYIVEASMGDDSGTSDYNLGDDGLVVTDAQGRILS